MEDLEKRLRKAIKHFWSTRDAQAINQGLTNGVKDAGYRSAVTGGKQMDGFVSLVCDLLCEVGVKEACVHCERHLELPGFFRPEKRWDLIVVADGTLLASIEFKSQIGPSFGNNFNNRTEEALGSATDVWSAYREGAFGQSPRPWLGYLMLLEESPKSTCTVRVNEPHFPVFEEFRGSSYAKRYEILLTKLVRERLYDSACFLTSDSARGRKGHFSEPSAELSFQNFVASLLAKAIAYVKTRENR
jgi:hypothetical protein